MSGLLTHLGISLLGFIIIYFIIYKTKLKNKIICGLGFAFGHLAPDLIDFGVLSIEMRSLNPYKIMTHPLFDTLALLGHTFSNWIILALIIFSISWLLYELGKISKKTFVKIIILIVLILIGILIHLKLDLIIIEKSPWI